MAKIVSFSIDGKECMAEEGRYLVDAAETNGVTRADIFRRSKPLM